jgi:GGDEF domain-containing protein
LTLAVAFTAIVSISILILRPVVTTLLDQQRLMEFSRRGTLAGLINQGTWPEILSQEINRAERNEQRATDARGAGHFAERLRQGISTTPISLSSGPGFVKASAGIAEWQGDLAQQQLVANADAARYESKRNGRDQIRVCDGQAARLSTTFV